MTRGRKKPGHIIFLYIVKGESFLKRQLFSFIFKEPYYLIDVAHTAFALLLKIFNHDNNFTVNFFLIHYQVVVAYAFNCITQETETGEFL